MSSDVPCAPKTGGRVRPLQVLAGWLLRCLGSFCRAFLIVWGALAIHWSNLPWPWLRLVLALGFAVLGINALFRSATRRNFLGFVGVFVVLMVWWASIRPSHDRTWRPEVSVMPRAVINGDSVKLTGVRHIDYRSKEDFTVRHEEREVKISHLTGVDFFVSYWSDAPMAHTFVSFIFDNAPPLCVSIEARLEQGEKYSPVASCFKQAELIYVVADERDIVGVRTHHRKERVYLYHLRSNAERARAFFRSYLEKINLLADQPEFYHLLSNNCTVNIDRHAHKEGRRGGFDFRLLVNGLVDAYAYARGALDISMPIDQLRERSLITEPALAGGLDDDFSRRIRQNLPPPPIPASP